MKTRLTLHQELKEILGSDNVYYRPPESVKLKYPCIIYNLGSGETTHADNRPYLFNKRYEITVISKNPDLQVPDKIAMHFPMSRMDRNYTADNLNHWVFSVYYG